MKIALLAAAATGFLHLKGPDGTFLYDDGAKVGIDLYGPGSPQFAQVEERISARVIKRMKDNDNQVSAVPIEERRANATEDMVALTAAFHNIEHDGPEGPLTGAALYSAVYSDPALGWIKAQVDKFVGDWGKFTPVSAGN